MDLNPLEVKRGEGTTETITSKLKGDGFNLNDFSEVKT